MKPCRTNSQTLVSTFLWIIIKIRNCGRSGGGNRLTFYQGWKFANFLGKFWRLQISSFVSASEATGSQVSEIDIFKLSVQNRTIILRGLGQIVSEFLRFEDSSSSLVRKIGWQNPERIFLAVFFLLNVICAEFQCSLTASVTLCTHLVFESSCNCTFSSLLSIAWSNFLAIRL